MKLDKFIYLYIITNIINNKKYVGQTINPSKRWIDHKVKSKKPIQYISRAIAKYGKENFLFDIVVVCKTQEAADELEDCLMNQYNSRDKNFGYNIKPGGAVATGWHHSEETKNKISKSEKGKIISEEVKAKMSISQKERVRSKDEWTKMSETKKKNKLLKFNSLVINAIKKEYDSGISMAILAEKYKTRRSTISKIIHCGSII